MPLERRYFPLRTVDRNTSPWPKKAQPIYVMVRAGLGVPTEKVAPTVWARVVYLTKLLGQEAMQVGETTEIA
eukprot:1549081-Pyramimonas_sp.AAC.1